MNDKTEHIAFGAGLTERQCKTLLKYLGLRDEDPNQILHMQLQQEKQAQAIGRYQNEQLYLSETLAEVIRELDALGERIFELEQPKKAWWKFW